MHLCPAWVLIGNLNSLSCFKPQVSLWKAVLCLIHSLILCLGTGGSKCLPKCNLWPGCLGSCPRSGHLGSSGLQSGFVCSGVMRWKEGVLLCFETHKQHLWSCFLSWTDRAVCRHTVLPSHQPETHGCIQNDRSSLLLVPVQCLTVLWKSDVLGTMQELCRASGWHWVGEITAPDAVDTEAVWSWQFGSRHSSPEQPAAEERSSRVGWWGELNCLLNNLVFPRKYLLVRWLRMLVLRMLGVFSVCFHLFSNRLLAC